jgi:hypothetical protein
MFERIDELIRKIQELEKQRDTELVSICICIHRNVKRGHLPDCFILGTHVWQLPALDYTMTDALGVVYQTAIKTSEGLGVVRWKALEYLQFREENCLEEQASMYFHVYINCNSFEKALALRDFGQLLEMLKERFQW